MEVITQPFQICQLTEIQNEGNLTWFCSKKPYRTEIILVFYLHVYFYFSSVYHGMTTTVFMETPLISTYLIAFVISDYDHITVERNGIQQSVYYPPGSLDKGEKSLENALKVLATMEELLQVKYTLKKLDHIMLSKTFGSAMENWGLITYNRDNFLHNEGRDGQKVLKDIITQAHEISHMWFGDLVTPTWWTYSWLNEGFATYYSYLTTEIVYPDWNIPEFFTSTVSDVANNWPISRPMTFFVEKENQIKLVFDMVSYQRGNYMIFNILFTLVAAGLSVAFHLRSLRLSGPVRNCSVFSNILPRV